jgi:hypothetical protein
MNVSFDNAFSMDLPHIVGWLAASLVLTSFYLKTIYSLRLVAAVSNIAFIFYAIHVSALPIFVLHVLLLPLNAFRLVQHFRLKNHIEKSSNGNLGKIILLPYMRRKWLPKGAVLFRKHDDSDKLFYIVDGSIELTGRAEIRGKDELLGVISVFTQDRKRLDTAVAKTDVQVGLIAVEKIKELMLQEPALSRFLLQCLAERTLNQSAQKTLLEFPQYPLSLSRANI